MIETELSRREMSVAHPQRQTPPWADKSRYTFFLIVGDALSLLLAFSLAYWLRFSVNITVSPEVEPNPATYFPLIGGIIIAWLLLFAAMHLYNVQTLLGGWSEFGRVVNACTSGMMLVVFITFLVRDLDPARGWLVMSWLLSLLIVSTVRFGARRYAYATRAQGHFLAPTLIVGVNAEAQALASQLKNPSFSGFRIMGFVAPSGPATSLASDGLPLDFPVLGGVENIGALIQRLGVEEVIVASSAVSGEQLVQLTEQVTENPHVQLRLSSGLYEIFTTGMSVTTTASVPLMTVSRLRLNTFETVLKTMLDYSVILMALPVLLPLFLVLAAIVKLDSPGPIFYPRRVVGLGGREFNALKFRTMVINGDAVLERHPDKKEELARTTKIKDDPRITRSGAWLRRYSLDELPQLINVVLGQMSLVGPRMIHPSEAARYGRMRANLLAVKPGLTGMWQVSGRSDLSYEERVRLDMIYVRNYSIWMDIQILVIQTLPAVIRGSGAY